VLAEIDSAHRDEERRPEVVVLELIPDEIDRRAVQECVPRHDDPVVLAAQRDNLARAGDGICERLLDEDVLARLERSAGESLVCADRRRDDDGFDRRVL
jgi:hypothetical protein